MTTEISPEVAARRRAGSGFAIGAYGLWALLPLFFIILEPAGPFEILALRVVFSVVFCAFLLTVMRDWRSLVEICRSGRTLGWLALAAVLISCNWLVFIHATTSGHVLETSLAYFMNPLMSIVIGVLAFHETLRRLQWLAVAIGLVAVIVMTVAYGQPPYLSLALSVSFAIYGVVKRHIGTASALKPVGAVPGMMVETAVLLVPALLLVAWLHGQGDLQALQNGWRLPLLLSLLGAVTAVPLVFFSAAAARLPLSWVGMFQYIAPVGQFIIGFMVMGEPMPAARWLGFAIVWVAVILLITDVVISGRRHRRPAGRFDAAA